MTDVRVTFLSRLASSISSMNKSNTLLKSFYLMRSRTLINNTALLQKYFPKELTCSRCGIKWTKGECKVNVKSKKITKSQKRKIKGSKKIAKCKLLKKKKRVEIGNQLEKVCQFCKHRTYINLIKPNVTQNKKTRKSNIPEMEWDTNDITMKRNKVFTENNKRKKILKEKINVYSSTKDVFSLLNKNNLIVPSKSKVVKHNKRKKDKFAGLCKEAVLGMVNKKKEKESGVINDRLNLFLKPSN